MFERNGTEMYVEPKYRTLRDFLMILCRICLIAAIASYLQRTSYLRELKPATPGKLNSLFEGYNHFK